MSKRQDELAAKAVKRLREVYELRPGSTVWTMVKHVSRSGMTRDIAVYLHDSDGIQNVSRDVAEATGYRFNRDAQAVRIGGAGMDMGFAIVYDLSRVTFRDGFLCSGKQDCPANDHVNERGDARKAGYRKGRKHSDPGYALEQRWLS
jgi:hypothetical protein